MAFSSLSVVTNSLLLRSQFSASHRIGKGSWEIDRSLPAHSQIYTKLENLGAFGYLPRFFSIDRLD
ncbi:MAG: hypothetical protein WBG66_06800, partial [Geitlerinemataceae cyanobacterium]